MSIINIVSNLFKSPIVKELVEKSFQSEKNFSEKTKSTAGETLRTSKNPKEKSLAAAILGSITKKKKNK